ncbi:MAG: carboxypeptidase regulatory-like domain-containing protein [Nitrospirota bacterium]
MRTSIIFFTLFFFSNISFGATVDSASLSPSSVTLKEGEAQTLVFSATNDKTFDIKTFHAEFVYTKGLKIANIETTPPATKATVNASKGIITFEWSNIAQGETLTAAFDVSGNAAGTFSITPVKITYSENRKTVYNGSCNSVEIVVLDRTAGTVSGTVSDASTGTPIGNVNVTIVDIQGTTFTTTTAESGDYVVYDVAQGSFTAVFRAKGYLEQTATGLSGGQTLILNILLTPENAVYETIRPTDAFNPGGWPNPSSGFDTDVNTYAFKNNVSTSPSISFGGSSSNESINAWQNKSRYWNSAYLYVTFEEIVPGGADDLVELQVTDRFGNLKHTLLPPTAGTVKKGFAQKLHMSDWGDGFNNIGDLRLRINGYRKRGADNAEARVYDLRINGDPSPYVKNYSRGAYTLLPTEEGDLKTDYTPAEIRKVSVDDDDRVAQIASYMLNEYPVHLFKEKPSSRSIMIKWNGQIYSQGVNDAYAFSFIPNSSGRLTHAGVHLYKTGSPDGTLRIRLKSELGGEVLAESLPIAESHIDTLGSWITFTFDSPAYVTAGRTYYMEIWRDKLDIDNNIIIYSHKVCSESSGFARYAGTWHDEATMGLFAVYIEGVSDVSSLSCDDIVSGATPVYDIYGLDRRTIYLEAYNRATAAWVRLDENPYDGSTSDIDLSGTISSADYFDAAGWIAVRVYAGTAGNSGQQLWYNVATDSIKFSIQGEISVAPLSLDFGQVMTDGFSTQNILISNIGPGDLLIGTIAAPAMPFEIASDGCSGVILSASSSCSVTVKFAPVSEGTFTDIMTIPSDDADDINVIVSLNGTAIPAHAAITGTVQDLSTGLPISGAAVVIADSAKTTTTTTNPDGSYNVSGLSEGIFTATFEKSGYISQTVTGTLTAVQTLSIDILLNPIPPLTLNIASPQDGAVLNSSPVTVTGNVSNDAQATVNGIQAVVSSGAFNATVPLNEGQNTITATAIDQYNQTASQSINVTLIPPLTISNVSVNNITADSATITWTTDQPSDSLVEYGETTGYGNTAADAGLVTAHAITLNNLSPDTTYHFKVTSRNAGSLSSSSGDSAFTTLRFKATTIGDYGSVTVMEVTGNYDAKNPDGSMNYLPRQEIAKEFYKNHQDQYDFFVIFSNFDFLMPAPDAKAFYLEVRNDVQGIGKPISDDSASYGSNSVLQGIIDMGNLSNLGINPADPKFEETLTNLSHEQMHRWGASVKFRDLNNNISSALIGKDGAHWSYLLDTDGSVLYGNDWKDNGDGTYASISASKYYSSLDLYLMGFYDRTQVPQMLLIDNSTVDPTKLPEAGATIMGTARYITIDDIIAAEGERIPNASNSQKTFKTAFIFITRLDTFTGNEINNIENMRNAWAGRFASLTNGKGTIMDVIPNITITIQSPTNGQTINGTDVMVKGVVINNTGKETGVTVNGMPATVYGNQFIANNVSLTEGSNTITVTATDTAGNTATTSINVNAVTTGNYIRITSNIESGIAPLEAVIRVDGSFSITSSNLNITGPVQPEVISSSADEYQLKFVTEGIYYITATATGPDNITYQDTIAIIVLNKNQLDALLKGKWEGMKTALANQDVAQALNYHSEESKQLYADIYTAFYDQLPQHVQEMQDIQLIYGKSNTAKYRLRENEMYGGNPETVTYYLYFVIDKDGVWKIYRY